MNREVILAAILSNPGLVPAVTSVENMESLVGRTLSDIKMDGETDEMTAYRLNLNYVALRYNDLLDEIMLVSE